MSTTNNNINNNKKGEVNITDYKIVSVNDNANLKDVYEGEKTGHTAFFNNSNNKALEHGQKLKKMFEEEYSFGRSRFAKNLKNLDKQTSSGISQILKKIEDS